MKRIFAGGDSSFATITSDSNQNLYDSRVYMPNTQIECMTIDLIKSCAQIDENARMVDLSLLTSMEHIFKNAACINASFDENIGCSMRNHGLNITAAKSAFELIKTIKKESFKEIVWDGITSHLLPEIVALPSTIDIEALRILLILPLYHKFDDGAHFENLHSPYGRSLTRLQNESHETVALWLSITPVVYFENLIYLFKEAVYFIMNNKLKISSGAARQPKREIVIDRHLRNLLEALKMLFKINRFQRKEIIDHEIFYLDGLNDAVHILNDFADYCMNENEHKVFFFNFPFLYDALAKKTILQADQTFSMFNAAQIGAVERIPYIQFTIRRNNIVNDAINEIERHVDNELKKELRIKFVDEPADDLGWYWVDSLGLN